MSYEAEDWLAQQEVARLETIYELESPELDGRSQPALETQKVRASKSRLPSDPSQENGAISG